MPRRIQTTSDSEGLQGVKRLAHRRHSGVLRVAPWIAPVLGLYGVFMVVPFILAVRYSFTSWDGVGRATFVGLRNYQSILDGSPISSEFSLAILHSIELFLIVYLASMLVGLPLAHALSRTPGQRARWFSTIFLIPLVLPPLVVGYVFLLYLEPDSGLAYIFGERLHIGLLTYPLLGGSVSALPTIALIIAWMSMGLVVTILWAAFLAIPTEVLEAARLDGASSIQEIRSVVIPIIAPAMITIGILELIGSFATFDIIYVTEGIAAGPGGSVDVLATLFYRAAFGGVYGGSNEVGLATAIVVLGFGFVIVVAGFGIWLQRRFRFEW